MEETYSISIVWQDIPIKIILTKAWLGGLADHLELRADTKLPVTETGYRSRFLQDDLDPADMAQFVTDWLDEAATSKDWQRHIENQRQGDLFDL